jgi:serine protease Do
MNATTVRAALASAALVLATALPTAPPAAAAGIIDAGLPDLVAKLLPSCVNITTTRYAEVQMPADKSVFTQTAIPDKKETFGSGFIVTTDGYVVTNKHVIRNGISYTVTFADGRVYPADFVAQADAFDIGVLKIRGSNETWPAVKLGDSDTLRRGDPVIAIGNPLGFQSTVTTGIISALNRDEGLTEFDDYIQTDAAINQGNSGGPLFNLNGEVIAVNSALQTATEGESNGNIGIGLAIPINDAKFTVLALKARLEGENWRPAYLGAGLLTITPDLAAAYGLAGPWGSIIASIRDGGPAALAKLRTGDIITNFNDKPVRDTRALLRAVIQTKAGSTVKLGVWRDGKLETIPVTLAELPSDYSLPTFLGGGAFPKPDVPASALANFGMQMSAITPDLRTKYKLDAGQQGVVVTAVTIGGDAANQNIDAGMVIEKVRDAPVSAPEDVLKSVATERQQRRSFVPMLISSADGRRWVAFSLQ